jgi:hypothetical protein
MLTFDDFLKKKNEEIKIERESDQTKGRQAHEDFLELQKLARIEWPKIIPAIGAETNGKMVDGNQFSRSGDSGIALGHITLFLLSRFGQGTYSAAYRTFSSNGALNDLANVDLNPILSGKNLLWRANGLGNHASFSTTELSQALAVKLVDVYQANEI